MTIRIAPFVLVLASAAAIAAAPQLPSSSSNDVAPTFSKDVAPILHARCASCHRPGEVAPMSLITFRDARPWAAAIRDKVRTRAMPPWHADRQHGTFRNDLSLGEREIETIVRWVDAGAREGDPAAAPPPPTFADGWQIGTPDVVFQMAEEYQIPATGTIDYQYFEVPTNFTDDRWMQAGEVRAGDRAHVHHIIVYVREPQRSTRPTVMTVRPIASPGQAAAPQAARPPAQAAPRAAAAPAAAARGGDNMLVNWAVGEDAPIHPPGTAKRIPAGSTLIFQVHYTTNGTPGKDRSRVGLIFAKEPPQREVRTGIIANASFAIPPGAADHVVEAEATFVEDARVWSMHPHMHLRGKDMTYTAIFPDGRSQIILRVPKYDFGWQTDYWLAEPLVLPKGSKLRVTAHFDNSTANRSNPDAAATVRWGDQTWEEMMIGFITYTADGQVVAAKDAAAGCTVAALQAKAPDGTTVKTASVVAASGSTPAYCQVDASVATPGNSVNFRLGLPATWNNKFYFEGVGGFAGSIGRLTAGLDRGYASASTDTGHQGGVTDASWALNNPAKELDYAHRGTHVTAVAAKALSGAYYGSAPQHAYFNGCSNGGRQALLEAQRYPGDFDGIVAVNPSFGTLGQMQRALIFQTLLKSPDHVLPPAKVKLLSEAVVASCDARDGLADGLISDPRACTFRPETLACSGADGPGCLTRGQVETVKAVYSDVRGPDGIVLHGFPMGHEDGATGWQQWITGATPPAPQADGRLAFSGRPPLGFSFADGFLRYLSFPEDDPSFDLRTFSFERHGAQVKAGIEAFSPSNADLAQFRKAGGKLLVAHGWSDPGLSAAATIAYYDEVVRTVGGRQQSDQFVKLFMAPGMHHCQGNGPGPNTFDLLTALEQWVERGVEPTRIVAAHAAGGVVDRTRPLCAYPQTARYVGTGSIDAAENFRCEAPPAETPLRK